MKKFLVVLVILTVVITGVFADPVVSGNGSLDVYGKIEVGGVTFKVNQVQQEANRVDLLTNADIQPDGQGYVVGNWDFGAQNQPANTDFTVAYTPSDLTSLSTGASVSFGVVEIVNSSFEEFYDYDDHKISMSNAPSLFFTQVVAVRLLEELDATAVPASDYKGSITVVLTKN